MQASIQKARPARGWQRAWGLIGISGIALVAIPAIWYWAARSSAIDPDPASPVTCGQGDSLELNGADKDVPGGVAVDARDGCRLRISGGRLRGRVAVRATSRAVVMIEGASLEGSERGIEVDGSSSVTLTKCSVLAPVAVRASEQALVVLRMGRATGAGVAIEARDRARVEVRDAIVIGETVNDPLARVVIER